MFDMNLLIIKVYLINESLRFVLIIREIKWQNVEKKLLKRKLKRKLKKEEEDSFIFNLTPF